MKFEKKKILIISSSFYPMNSPRSFRTTELVKEFARKGHKVTLVIPKIDKSHIPFEKEFDITIKNLGNPKLPKINIKKGNRFIILFKRGLKRGLHLFFEYPNIELMFQVKNILKKQNDFYDLLISIAVPFPIHWGVAWARNKKNPIAKIWIADCGDPYYFNTHDSFKKLFYFKYLEKWFSKKADYITIPFEGLKKYFFKEFKDKYKVIPQGFNFDEVKITNKLIDNEVVTFTYAGGFIKKARDPDKFLKFLLTVKEPFKFIIYNQQKEFTEPYKSRLKDKLVIKNYIPRNKLLNELSKMDFLVNFEYNPINQSPSKLIDYSLVKRPILLIRNNEFNKKYINEFLKKSYKNQFKFKDLERYNIKNVVTQFLELIN